MNRRTALHILSGTALGFTGCLSRTDASTDTPNRFPKSVEVTQQQAENIDLAANQKRKTITPEETARLWLQLTNSTETTVTVTIDSDEAQPQPVSAKDPDSGNDTGPYLIPEAATYPTERAAKPCWGLEALRVPSEIVAMELEPGKSVSLHHRLWAGIGADTCLEEKTYRVGVWDTPYDPTWYLDLTVKYNK
jgi:hypothetical protein